MAYHSFHPHGTERASDSARAPRRVPPAEVLGGRARRLPGADGLPRPFLPRLLRGLPEVSVGERADVQLFVPEVDEAAALRLLLQPLELVLQQEVSPLVHPRRRTELGLTTGFL